MDFAEVILKHRKTARTPQQESTSNSDGPLLSIISDSFVVPPALQKILQIDENEWHERASAVHSEELLELTKRKLQSMLAAMNER